MILILWVWIIFYLVPNFIWPLISHNIILIMYSYWWGVIEGGQILFQIVHISQQRVVFFPYQYIFKNELLKWNIICTELWAFGILCSLTFEASWMLEGKKQLTSKHESQNKTAMKQGYCTWRPSSHNYLVSFFHALVRVASNMLFYIYLLVYMYF